MYTEKDAKELIDRAERYFVIAQNINTQKDLIPYSVVVDLCRQATALALKAILIMQDKHLVNSKEISVIASFIDDSTLKDRFGKDLAKIDKLDVSERPLGKKEVSERDAKRVIRNTQEILGWVDDYYFNHKKED